MFVGLLAELVTGVPVKSNKFGIVRGGNETRTKDGVHRWPNRHLPLHINGPRRYGGKSLHKCIPESSGFEQI